MPVQILSSYNVINRYRVVLSAAVVEYMDKSDVLYVVLIKRKNCGPILYFIFLGYNRIFAIIDKVINLNPKNMNIIDINERKNKIVFLGTGHYFFQDQR